VASLRAGSAGAGAGLFVAYAAGMGLAVGAAALAVGLLRTSLIRASRWWPGRSRCCSPPRWSPAA
jgi:cytochrome c-type biogenesis protein